MPVDAGRCNWCIPGHNLLATHPSLYNRACPCKPELAVGGHDDEEDDDDHHHDYDGDILSGLVAPQKKFTSKWWFLRDHILGKRQSERHWNFQCGTPDAGFFFINAQRL